jgi:hypothetical protein
LYKLVTGRSPHDFPDSTPDQLFSDIEMREPVQPSKLVPKLSRDLDVILAKALRKEPEERYRTVDEFAADLQAFVEFRPISARRRNWIYLARKYWGFSVGLFGFICAIISVIFNRQSKALHPADAINLVCGGIAFGVAIAVVLRVHRKGAFK